MRSSLRIAAQFIELGTRVQLNNVSSAVFADLMAPLAIGGLGPESGPEPRWQHGVLRLTAVIDERRRPRHAGGVEKERAGMVSPANPSG